MAFRLPGGWRRLVGKAPEGASRWDQTSWQRAAVDTSALAAGRAVLFMLIGAVVFGAAGAAGGANLLPFDSIFWRLLFGALIGLLAGVCVWLVLMVYFWLRAPYKQRDEARTMIREAKDLRNLVQAHDFLSKTLEANTRILEELAKQQRTGPVAEDDDPWIRGQNEQTRLQLEMLGFADLAPVAVLDDLKIETCEGVTADGKAHRPSPCGGSLRPSVPSPRPAVTHKSELKGAPVLRQSARPRGLTNQENAAAHSLPKRLRSGSWWKAEWRGRSRPFAGKMSTARH